MSAWTANASLHACGCSEGHSGKYECICALTWMLVNCKSRSNDTLLRSRTRFDHVQVADPCFDVLVKMR